MAGTRNIFIAVAFGTICASPLGAQQPFVSSAGDDYAVSMNANGFAMTSLYPKARFVEQGAGSYVVRGIETFYFGVSCDALHNLFGQGTWGWANGGFGASFDGFEIWFPRQSPPENSGSNCEL